MSQMVRVLGIDPGTITCGIADVIVPLTGEARVLSAFTIKPGAGDWVARVRKIRHEIERMESQGQAVDLPRLLAIETPYSKTGENSEGHAGLEVVWSLVGALVSQLHYLDVELLVPNTVAAQFGAVGMNRDAKKVAAVDWARRVFSLRLGDKEHDTAEAVAVAMAGGKRWREAEWTRRAELRQPRLDLKIPKGKKRK